MKVKKEKEKEKKITVLRLTSGGTHRIIPTAHCRNLFVGPTAWARADGARSGTPAIPCKTKA